MTPQAAAHLRLMSTLPVHTIEGRQPVYSNPSHNLVLRGRRYPSVLAASKSLKVSRATIRRMIARGEGRYL